MTRPYVSRRLIRRAHRLRPRRRRIGRQVGVPHASVELAEQHFMARDFDAGEDYFDAN